MHPSWTLYCIGLLLDGVHGQMRQMCESQEEMATIQLDGARVALSTTATTSLFTGPMNPKLVMCCANSDKEATKAPLPNSCRGIINTSNPICDTDMCNNPTYKFKAPSQGCSPYVLGYKPEKQQELCWVQTWVRPDTAFCQKWCVDFGSGSFPCECTYASIFKAQCPSAYSWQFDDKRSLKTCRTQAAEAGTLNDLAVYLFRACENKDGTNDQAVEDCLSLSKTPVYPAALTALAAYRKDERVIVVENRRSDTVYPAISGQSWAGVRIVNSPTVSPTSGGPLGFELPGNSFELVFLPQYVQAGILWFRTGCKMTEDLYDFGGKKETGLLCESGQCIQGEDTYNSSQQGVLCGVKGAEPPNTVLEFSLEDFAGGRDGSDLFDVSALDGPSTSAMLAPLPVPGRSPFDSTLQSCGEVKCGPSGEKEACPPELRVYSMEKNLSEVTYLGCHSICKAISSMMAGGVCDPQEKSCIDTNGKIPGFSPDGKRYTSTAVNLLYKEKEGFEKLKAIFFGEYQWCPTVKIPSNWKVPDSTPTWVDEGLWLPSPELIQNLTNDPGSLPPVSCDASTTTTAATSSTSSPTSTTKPSTSTTTTAATTSSSSASSTAKPSTSTTTTAATSSSSATSTTEPGTSTTTAATSSSSATSTTEPGTSTTTTAATSSTSSATSTTEPGTSTTTTAATTSSSSASSTTKPSTSTTTTAATSSTSSATSTTEPGTSTTTTAATTSSSSASSTAKPSTSTTTTAATSSSSASSTTKPGTSTTTTAATSSTSSAASTTEPGTTTTSQNPPQPSTTTGGKPYQYWRRYRRLHRRLHRRTYHGEYND